MKPITNIQKIYKGVVLITFIVSGSLLAQEKVSPKIKQEKVPPEVQKIIDETLSGQHGLFNFEAHKIEMGFESTTTLSDLKAGTPFKVYKIYRDSLLKMDEDAPVSMIAKPLPIWGVPVLINGKCVTTFEVEKSVRTQQWGAGVFNGCYNEWEKVREAWPDSAGYHPVKVMTSAWTWFYHVPEKDDSNLTPLYRHQYDSLERAADISYKNLMHSRITLKYEKAHLPLKPNRGAK